MQPQPPPPSYPQPPPGYGYAQPPPRKSNTVWIVLAIVGVVLVIAVVAYISMMNSMKYMKKTKRSEAEVNLDAIKKGVKSRIADYGGFIEGSTALTPDSPCCDSGEANRKCLPDPSAWLGSSVWGELDFQVDEPHYFQYSYEGTADHFVAMAVGDLDCDDTYVTYKVEGDYNDGNPTYAITKPSRAD